MGLEDGRDVDNEERNRIKASFYVIFQTDFSRLKRCVTYNRLKYKISLFYSFLVYLIITYGLSMLMTQ